MGDLWYETYMGRGPKRIAHIEHWSNPDAATYITGIDFYAHPRTCMARLNGMYEFLNFGLPASDDPLPPYNPSAPPDQQFRNPVHCVVLANDGLLYVCDRQNDRVQVFKPDGTFIKEMYYEKDTKGSGSAWDLVLSKDPQQKYMFLADGENDRVHIIERQSMELLTTFGEGGRQPGEFYGVHSIALDSKGNLYTTETYRGQRLQKFVYKGLAPVTAKDQGVLWPKK